MMTDLLLSYLSGRKLNKLKAISKRALNKKKMLLQMKIFFHRGKMLLQLQLTPMQQQCQS